MNCQLEEHVITTDLDISELSRLVVDANGTLHTTVRSAFGRVMHVWLPAASITWQAERITRSGEETNLGPFVDLEVAPDGTVRAGVLVANVPYLATRQGNGTWDFQTVTPPSPLVTGLSMQVRLKGQEGWMIFRNETVYAQRIGSQGVSGSVETVNTPAGHPGTADWDAQGRLQLLEMAPDYSGAHDSALVTRSSSGTWTRTVLPGVTYTGNVLARADGSLETVSVAYDGHVFGALNLVRLSAAGAVLETRPLDTHANWGVGQRQVLLRSNGRRVLMYDWYDRTDSIPRLRLAVEQADGSFLLRDVGSALTLDRQGPHAALREDVLEMVLSGAGTARHWRVSCL